MVFKTFASNSLGVFTTILRAKPAMILANFDDRNIEAMLFRQTYSRTELTEPEMPEICQVTDPGSREFGWLSNESRVI